MGMELFVRPFFFEPRISFSNVKWIMCTYRFFCVGVNDALEGGKTGCEVICQPFQDGRCEGEAACNMEGFQRDGILEDDLHEEGGDPDVQGEDFESLDLWSATVQSHIIRRPWSYATYLIRGEVWAFQVVPPRETNKVRRSSDV